MKHFYILIIAILYSSSIQADPAPFITTWEVIEADLDITIPTSGSGYNYTIDFGDGTVLSDVTDSVSHTYNSPGVYTVTISGDFPRIFFKNSPLLIAKQIKSVEQWGDISWTSMEGAFSGCFNLVINATDAPNLSQVTSLREMFNGCFALIGDLSEWDVSNITDMTFMFRNCRAFNSNINNWNVSNVLYVVGMFESAHSFNQPLNNWDMSNKTSLGSMFEDATEFNQPLNNWDVSNVTNMSGLFNQAEAFNQPIDNWDVSNVTKMPLLFYSATSYNQPLNNWDVSNVTDMSGMFAGASNFNQPLDLWDVSNVRSMDSMFSFTNSFNQPIDVWDTSSVLYMEEMFNRATSFNQPINSWDVSNISSMDFVFHEANAFNQPLDNWNVANVTSMVRTFQGAESFNQSINIWDVSNVTDMNYMFRAAKEFNQDLNDWDVSNVVTMRGMFIEAFEFNKPLDNWNVSNVQNMESLFYRAYSFNQPLNDWNVTNSTNLAEMFAEASSFNQPLNDWNISNVIKMAAMFTDATSFNQDLSNWDFNPSVEFHGDVPLTFIYFLDDSAMSISNYEKLLARFAQLGLQGKKLGVRNLEFCNQEDRDYLIDSLGWTFLGDSKSDCNVIIGDVLFDHNNNGCDPNDIGVTGFMIHANNGSSDFTTYSMDGNYRLPVTGTTFTASIVNPPSYFSISPASATVTFSGSDIEVLDFCVTANQTVEDLNITILPTQDAQPGFDAAYQLVVRNVGTETIANVEITLSFDDLMQQFISANPTPSTTTENTLTFSIGNLQPFHIREIDVIMLTFPSPTVEEGDILNFTAEVTPIANDHTPDDNIYELMQIVVNSSDSNKKHVLQGEELSIDRIDEYLDYLIRFQNTGTTNVINMHILDTLHLNLDWNTFIPIGASHDYFVRITDGNRVEFLFDDINLSDKATNEQESHGFVAYKIKPKSDIQVGDVISGNAAIYFDSNEPIITNTVETRIVGTVGLEDHLNPENNVVLYPNPVNELLNVYRTSNVHLEEIIIYDLHGKVVRKFLGNVDTIQVGNLASGVYFIDIKTNGSTFTKQILIF